MVLEDGADPAGSAPAGGSWGSREPDAFARAHVVGLYERHGSQLYNYCLRRLGNPQDAEDATQIAFLNAFRWMSRNDFRTCESPWLFSIAENVCLNTRRSAFRRKRVEIPSDFEDSYSYGYEEAYEKDTIVKLCEALRALSAQQRQAILLREWKGLSYREIGDALGLSQSATEALLFRARRTLVGLLADERPPPDARPAGEALGA